MTLIASCATFTVDRAISITATDAGQLLPAVADVTVLASTLFPASGLLTVTENVTVTTAPTGRFPDQVRFGLVQGGRPRGGRVGRAVVGGIIQHTRTAGR